MGKYMVTVGAGTSAGAVKISCATTAKINGKPIATVGSIATHPKATDVLVEGIPTILLNGKPISFSTAKTAKGATIAPNTSVKITSPSFESYTGFTPAPRIEKRLVEEKPKEEPEVSPCYTLQSDYAKQELIKIAQQDGRLFFQLRIMQIFGKDVTPKALDKLYDECVKGSIENADIVVCENKIHGLVAAYNNKTNKIYVSRGIVDEAITCNDTRHKLMAALIEEYGHHIDYLLRFKFDKNKNKDAKHDEGARFAYQAFYNVHYINFQETTETPFASGTSPQGAFQLVFDYSDLYQALSKYTANRQEDTDDHVGDDWEGFKVEDLSTHTPSGYGHENIQRTAVQQANIKVFSQNIDFLYRGNWLRDYSQILAPFLLHNLGAIKGNTLDEIAKNFLKTINEADPDHEIAKDGQPYNTVFAPTKTIPFLKDMIRLLTIDKFLEKEMIEKKVSYTLIRQEQLDKDFNVWRTLVDGSSSNSLLLEKRNESIKASNKHEDLKNKQAEKSKIAQARVDEIKAQIEYAKTVGIIPGFDELLGASVPYDHFDNPYGLKDNKALHDFLKNNSEVAVYDKILNTEISEYLTKVGDTHGIKNHIRACREDSTYIANKDSFGTKIVYDHLEETFKDICKTNFNFDGAYRQSMVNITRLGGALHTVQDFYAHSNYSEVYLVQRWFDKVYTWTHADWTRNYKDKPVRQGSVQSGQVFGAGGSNPRNKIISNLVPPKKNMNQLITEEKNKLNIYLYKPVKIKSSQGDGYGFTISEEQRSALASEPPLQYQVNKKAFFAPITSGTYDMEDMLATFVSMLSDILIPINEKYDANKVREAKVNESKQLLVTTEPGGRSLMDMQILVLLRFYDQVADNNQNVTKLETEKKYLEFLALRDDILRAYKEVTIEVKIPLIPISIDTGITIEDLVEALRRGLEQIIDFIIEYGPEDLVNAIKKVKRELDEIVEDVKRTIKSLTNSILSQIIKVGVSLIATYQLMLKDEMAKAIEDIKRISEETKDIDILLPKGMARLEAAIKSGTKNALWGKYPLRDNPSHTMLAKDDATHPIHSLSGDMAVRTTRYLLDTVNLDLSSKGSEKTISILSKIVSHPLENPIYDDIVDKWAFDNPVKVLRLSVSCYYLETFRAAIVFSNSVRSTVNSIYGESDESIMLNRLMQTVAAHLPQTTVNTIGEAAKTLKESLVKLIDAYMQSPYRELDGETFIEWYKLYMDEGHPFFFNVSLDELRKMKERWLAELDRRLILLRDGDINMKFEIPFWFY